MTEKVVVITGGAGGIGMETAKAFLDQGDTIVLVDINQEALNKTKDLLDVEEERVLVIQANVTEEADVANYVKQTVDAYGRIDVFFNNAGINGPHKPIKELDKEQFETIMAINVTGVFLGLKHVIRQMEIQGYGSIINTASNAAYIGAAGMSGYIASKHAVVGLTKTAALETAAHGIRVNAVAPAAIDTQMLTAIQSNISPGDPELAASAIRQGIPVGRFGMPLEVAQIVLFLASEKSSFVTGSIYNVDGGMQAD
ncbi:SDR family NAD(P)-dependent oxidoreductase [Planococcus shenhongbingii]|uniref:SDR family NAD(P)-dependent oxidoreductase n=1 Tax=Planococcus shenhongbingii TaxID=3058398 RepID=A0ABT8NEQ7_9BACL|nr:MULTISPECIES: SDR family NAD(P)-dependent oxidoreductase [unclassified Planococcus (in: firmicutes)]MDN7246321.1 SDR family NAD(P)-dependent oxidoreductase [Planococcus sp. N017]WKA59327.1 SDR family NAD(P)-dependent oxidoreductase [Planococcus sp. N016]